MNYYLIATDFLVPASLADENSIIENYLWEEEGGIPSIEGNTIDSLNTFLLSCKYLFQSERLLLPVIQGKKHLIYDLTTFKGTVATFDQLDDFYPAWIQESKRDNTMDEYGMFLGWIGYIARHAGKKYLLAILYED